MQYSTTFFVKAAKWLVMPAVIISTVSCGGSSGSGDGPEVQPTAIPTQQPTIQPTAEPGNEATTQLDCGSMSGAIVANHLNDAAKAYLLCKHNESRSQIALGNFMGLYGNFAVATDMKRLQWDAKLETVAQNWANQCQWQHNSNRATEYNALSPTDINGNPIAGSESVGENLAYFASSALTAASLEYALSGYKAWVDEGQDYSMGAFNVSDFCDNEPCGHFTQVIWANTYKVGCAVNYCAAGTVSSLASTYLVCDYASAGNYIGQMPYATGSVASEVCSTADTGQSVCNNGLTQASDYQSGLP